MTFGQVISYLQANPVEFIVYAVVLGLLVGSFLNVVIHRLPIMLEKQWLQESEAMLNPDKASVKTQAFNLWVPKSACPHCKIQITAWHNIPVLSYLFLLGRCHNCKTPISMRYPLVEILSAIACGLLAWKFGPTLSFAGVVLFTWFLLCLFFIDYQHQLLPDDLTFPLLWLGFAFNINHTFASLTNAVIGAMAGYIFLWLIYWLFKLITKKEGMGYGDFKLMAALCAWVGWIYLPIIALVSALISLIMAIVLKILAKRELKAAMPYGPSLAIAGWIVLLWGPYFLKLFAIPHHA